MISIVLPAPLCELAKVENAVSIGVNAPVTFNAVFDALEEKYPALRGTIRNKIKNTRRPMIRIFACETDYSHHSLSEELPAEVVAGKSPLIIVAAIAGG